MRFKMIVLTGLAGLLVLAPMAFAAGPCCDDKACCQEMAACCMHQGDNDAAAVLLPAQDQEFGAARQSVVVFFMRPVLVGNRILQGKYIIEHDTYRMALGLPCTHIYAASDRRIPVVEFHCTHLERPRADKGTVVVASTGDPTGLQKLVAFQFGGETAAHGVPVGR